MYKKIEKLLVANRGEIAIRIFRACKEVGISTVAIYSKEDMGGLHRQRADESYLVGKDLGPIEAYLDIEGIIKLAKEKNVDAIHPGYGFLSENIEFAKRCREEGIIFVGPESRHLEMFGNKTRARETAIAAGLPVIPGTDGAIKDLSEAKSFAESHGYPVMIKAVSGGGGKGMRIVNNGDEIADAYQRAKSEAKTSFGDDRIYVEKYVANPKHIEVQILGDMHGNVIHLFERDCSIQRRHQKVVEVAPSFNLSESMRQRLADASIQLMENVSYLNAGTVEFLVAGDDFYFIEVNPRIQVEHTITELVTGIDIVKTQIKIAEGLEMFSDEVGVPKQEDIRLLGYAIQGRVTSEDPLNDFAPDSGRIIGYQSPGGTGVRLDGGGAFTGAEITPYYDSLLVKISTFALQPRWAIEKMERALTEMKINGIKTNIKFLQNIVSHPRFVEGDYDTSFITEYPELFEFVPSRDRGNKLLKYIANISVNGFPGVSDGPKPIFEKREIPRIKGYHQTIALQSGDTMGQTLEIPAHTKPSFKHILDKQGPKAVADAVLKENNVLLTDTTLRDAHQSVLTTRMRTNDMLKIAPFMNETMRDYFSLEMWGGATFDVAYNFLKESPWDRLEKLRLAIPDIPFQMLLRASNAVGYQNYPDNVVKQFIATSAREGIDVFRIFDSLNWLESMKLPIELALETGKFVEGTICYTGDISNPKRSEVYTLDYYVELAKQIESLGVHSLAIKDMSGVLKPEAAYQLISALKSEIKVPLHLHTHDTSSNGLLTYSRAIDAGVDIVDTANQALAGQNSQPSDNSLYYGRQGTQREVLLNPVANDLSADYWKETRKYYKSFETDLTSAWTQVYEYEMPGGQYSNLRMQAKSMGLGERYHEVLAMYRRVNFLFGDIVKVTPSSKVVGDMALFMVQNDLDEESVIEKGMTLDFPQSVVSFFKGEIGQPAGGMNKALQKAVLKDEVAYTDRPGKHMADYNFDEAREIISQRIHGEIDEKLLLSYALYPKVFKDFLDFVAETGLVDMLDSPTFFYGMRPHETLAIDLEPGKTMLIELTSIGSVKENGTRTVFFNLNGMSHFVVVQDLNAKVTVATKQKADLQNPQHVAAQMPGTVFAIEVKVGEQVKQNDVLIITEAMKMETAIRAPKDGIIKAIHCSTQEIVAGGDLLVELD